MVTRLQGGDQGASDYKHSRPAPARCKLQYFQFDACRALTTPHHGFVFVSRERGEVSAQLTGDCRPAEQCSPAGHCRTVLISCPACTKFAEYIKPFARFLPGTTFYSLTQGVQKYKQAGAVSYNLTQIVWLDQDFL